MSLGRILVVDDDPQIRRAMRVALTARGYEVDDARTGEEALAKMESWKSDVVLLDENMPGMGGLQTCRQLRAQSEVAIIMITVRNTERDKVEALDAGADDYVTKPFSTGELLARIRAALRRLPQPATPPAHRLTLGEAEIDFAARQIILHGEAIHLTPKEFDLLLYLAARPNKTISHRELLQAVWGPDYGDEVEYLRVFVNRLRKKIEPDPARPRFLLTDAWSGYRLATPK